MIRRATFVLVLVAAAFGGGAAINGPGLAWLQRAIAGGPSIIVDGEPGPPPPAAKPKQFPTAKVPTLRVDFDRSGPPPGKKAGASSPDLALADPPLPPESLSTPAAALIPIPGAPLPAPASPPAAPPGDPLPPLELPPEPPPTPAKSDPVARLASASSGPALEAPPAGMPPSAPAAPSAPAPAASGRDWGEIRRRLRTLGVTRYTIEAETDGRVRFSCVIPVDGLKAVGHHFEAEGDDEHQAAEAALKRVALWRATEAR